MLDRALGICAGVAVVIAGLTGCASAPQVSVKAGCSQWMKVLEHAKTETLASEFVEGVSRAHISTQVKTWPEMVDGARQIGPQLHDADRLAEGYFQKFAEAGDRAISAAHDAEGGDTSAVERLESLRKVFLDRFYSVAQLCVGDVLGGS